jgi:uncharacterized repeat protein (TIGR01451 family)
MLSRPGFIGGFVRFFIVGLCLLGARMLGANDLSSFHPTAAAVSSLPDLVVRAGILGDPVTVSPGEVFHYFLVVTNQGSDMPTDSTTKVLDQLPSRVTFISAEEGARAQPPFFLGVTCTFSSPLVLCEGPPLVQGDHYVVLIDVQVNGDAKGGNLVDLTFVNPLGEVVESAYNNNMDKVKVKIQ